MELDELSHPPRTEKLRLGAVGQSQAWATAVEGFRMGLGCVMGALRSSCFNLKI